MSPSDPDRTPRLKSEARRLGFELVGIAAPDPSAHMGHYREWIEAGLSGDMGYLARPDAVQRRSDLHRTLDGVRSVVVVGHGYGQDDPPGVPDDPSLGVIARYARGRDYHRVVKKKLLGLARWLDGEEPGGAHRAYVDTGPILERELAQRAGLGWFGKNTMLISPGRGSYFFLGVLLTTVELDPDPPFEADRCGTCTACLDACPTGALLGRNEDGAPVLDARLCISYLTIEHRGETPEELRAPMGNRIYGCDICQEVCPWNGKFGMRGAEPGYAPRDAGEAPAGVAREPGWGAPHPGTGSPALMALLETALDPGRWDAFSRGSALRRAGREGFLRNVCVGLGNWGAPEAVPALVAAMAEPDPGVRAHAAWALERLHSGGAGAAPVDGPAR